MLLTDGTFVEVMPDGSTRPSTRKSDWERVRAITDEEVEAAALSDPDAQPLTEEELSRMKLVPRAYTLRRALGLTQEEFADRYRIAIGTLRDWEEGHTEPDQTARTYHYGIAADPDGVARSLETRPSRPAAALAD
jgi:putative transcriptional regulator